MCQKVKVSNTNAQFELWQVRDILLETIILPYTGIVNEEFYIYYIYFDCYLISVPNFLGEITLVLNYELI